MTDELMPAPPAPPRKKEAEPAKVRVMLQSEFPLVDPDLDIRFMPQVAVEVPRITTWMQYQIDAGLMVQL
jgi:hypothetical protein